MRKRLRLDTTLLLVGVLLVAAGFRLTGLNWGEGQPIHPDEEFLRQVTTAVRLPDRLATYFDTSSSPLNPYNRGYGFFVYGTFPLFLTRALLEGMKSLSPTSEFLEPFTYDPRLLGRALAALFDLGSVALVFFLARRAFGRWVGLLSALLYALSVLPIQQSHFYTVDAYANFFVTATLYLATGAAQTGRWPSFLLAGLTTGLGLACKISVWPLAVLIGVSGLVWGALYGPRGSDGSRRWWPALLRLVASGLVAFWAFRIAQPYAFNGPGLLGISPNPRWLENMAEIRNLMSGAVDTYPGHQWTNRTPLVFPWMNIVFWGLGLPLGLMAWAGWGLAAYDLARAWWRVRGSVRGKQGAAEGEAAIIPASIVPLFLLCIWTIGYFLYQGTQWVKSMRYLLPIYPTLAVSAGWLARRLWAGSPAAGGAPRRYRSVALAAAALGTIGALLWALAFTSVYRRPHTRIAASRWIFEHVPAAATLHLDAGGGPSAIQVAIPPGTYCAEGSPLVVPFSTPAEVDGGQLVVTEVSLNYVTDPLGDAEAEKVLVSLSADPSGAERLVESVQTTSPPPPRRGTRLTFHTGPVTLRPDSTYYLIIETVEGGSIQLFTSVLATEHWDWPPPLRVDGRDPFGGMYQGLSTSSDGTLQLYHDDTIEKQESLLNWLDEADYIIIGSNRLYASIPRLPTRYPLTIAYYQALFSGQLGFELVADFTSYPTLGPLQFPDTEEPFPIPRAGYEYRAAPVSVPMPPAEEAFSVYDHPRVLIFRKTPAFSRQRAEWLLPESLVEEVIWVTPRDATRGVRPPELDPQTWAQQQAGGTWSEMFDRQSPLNRRGWLAAAVWYLATTLLGWLAFPALFLLLPGLADRGYGIARALGLLLIAYLTWLAASLRLSPNTRPTILISVAVLALIGGAAAWRQRELLIGFLRRRWRMVLTYEIITLVLFGTWTWVRALNPDLWHPVVGGEKPMDFAYLNAVIKSTWFPPYDPWFAGGYINYYYFGFVLVSTLAKLLGVMPSIAYNLSLPLFYALAGSAAFSVAFNLVSRKEERAPEAYLAGVLAILLLLVLGNLGEVRLLVNGFRIVAGEPPFKSTIPGFAELMQALRGFWLVLRGAQLPFRPESPYWDPTRMYPADPLGVGPITEFPAFTFLYGDLHAHMLALPYTLAVLALALNWALRPHRKDGSLLVGALLIGCLRAANTWDFPTYLAVAFVGIAIGTLDVRRGIAPRDLWAFLWRASAVLLGSILLFQPYIHNYVIAYTRFHIWEGVRTPLGTYLLHVGHFLFVLATLLVPELRQAARWAVGLTRKGPRLAIAMIAAGAVVVAAGLWLFGVPIALAVVPLTSAALMAGLQPTQSPQRRLVWLFVALALALTLAVEIVVLEGDIGRMNTVFKFYYQVWTLLSVATAAATVWVLDRVVRWPVRRQHAWSALLGALLFAAALFPAMSIPAKVKDRITDLTGPTLDGMAYMEHGKVWDVLGEVDLRPDYEAIVWMLDHIEGSPVVLEGLGAREYLWGNRVSVYTGLPTVVGWRWHQVQQRMAAGAGEVDQRHLDVNECYETVDTLRAEQILRRYGVCYIYVGPYERLYYSPEGLAKFDEMVDLGVLRVVYDRMGVKIYEVLRSP